MMWRRLRRRSLAPNRPAVWPEQWGLVLLTAVALVAGAAAVVIVLTHG
jgi:hypothetical protein